MPSWMQLLYQKMRDPLAHVNVRWFIAKIVLNRWKIFEVGHSRLFCSFSCQLVQHCVRIIRLFCVISQPYAVEWFFELVELTRLPAEENGGHGFHYFLRDLCFLFLNWHDSLRRPTDARRVRALPFLGGFVSFLHCWDLDMLMSCHEMMTF